jgi:hypothetical protein
MCVRRPSRPEKDLAGNNTGCLAFQPQTPGWPRLKPFDSAASPVFASLRSSPLIADFLNGLNEELRMASHTSAAIHARIGHLLTDWDGRWFKYAPVFLDHAKRVPCLVASTAPSFRSAMEKQAAELLGD